MAATETASRIAPYVDHLRTSLLGSSDGGLA
jgi:hypothetical protein